MAYTVTFHGVTKNTFDTLKTRVKAFDYSLPDDAQGVVSGPDVEATFRYDEDAKTLAVSIRRKPALMSHGQLYGTIADALLEMGAEHTDTLLS